MKDKKNNLPTPKRGAFPTPKEEIESATPYSPKSDKDDDEPRENSDRASKRK
jgi:hypothetical protein